MSAPDTDVEKQAKRHAPSLAGIAGAIALAAAVAVLVIAAFVTKGEDASGDELSGRMEPSGAIVAARSGS